MDKSRLDEIRARADKVDDLIDDLDSRRNFVADLACLINDVENGEISNGLACEKAGVTRNQMRELVSLHHDLRKAIIRCKTSDSRIKLRNASDGSKG